MILPTGTHPLYTWGPGSRLSKGKSETLPLKWEPRILPGNQEAQAALGPWVLLV